MRELQKTQIQNGGAEGVEVKVKYFTVTFVLGHFKSWQVKTFLNINTWKTNLHPHLHTQSHTHSPKHMQRDKMCTHTYNPCIYTGIHAGSHSCTHWHAFAQIQTHIHCPEICIHSLILNCCLPQGQTQQVAWDLISWLAFGWVSKTPSKRNLSSVHDI